MIKKSVYGYCRISGRKQLGGHGLDRQEQTIRKFCRANGFKVEKMYREIVSGKCSETQRPRFSNMIAEILSNSVRIIIVESLDRLAREYRIQESLLVFLASKGIDLIAANTGENITEAIKSDPMKKALVQMQGIFSELEKSLLVKKLRKARDRVREKTGRCEGPRPYGSTSPEEKEILKRVRILRRKPKLGKGKRRTLLEIAEILNSEGIKSRQGKEWSPGLVANILRK